MEEINKKPLLKTGLLLVIATALFVAGCKNDNGATPVPRGNYTGQLYVSQINPIIRVVFPANIVFNKGNFTSSYLIAIPTANWSGNPIVVSAGTYQLNDSTINFTPVPSTTQTPQLSGTYKWYFKQDSLIITMTNGTVSSYQYRLKQN